MEVTLVIVGIVIFVIATIMIVGRVMERKERKEREQVEGEITRMRQIKEDWNKDWDKWSKTEYGSNMSQPPKKDTATSKEATSGCSTPASCGGYYTSHNIINSCSSDSGSHGGSSHSDGGSHGGDSSSGCSSAGCGSSGCGGGCGGGGCSGG